MRMSVLLLTMVLASASAGQRPPAAPTGPCTTSTAQCTEWVTLGAGPARSMIYTSHSLDTRNERIGRALIMIHGTNRNADHYFATAVAAAFLAGALDDTVVIAPHLIACDDKPDVNEVVWSCGGDSWRSGGASTSHPDLFSFDFADQILRKLANKNVFPNMRAIVVAGHSAGGQFVARYQMSNHVHETLGVPVSYIVANPSSYAWPAAMRPTASGDAEPADAKEAWKSESPHTNFTFGPFEASQCQAYNRWPFGLENRSSGYTAKTPDTQLKKQLVSRPATYLLGQVDTLPLGGFDSSCGAMAQGPTRRARGEAFVKFIAETLGAKHKAIIVPECGHNDRCVYTTESVLPVIFPK
jgi:pimeloyl-ACP methyl ester carboxylesterase